MAYTPFFQGTDAQNVINSFLGSGVTATTPMSPADMNANNVFRNPYSPEGFYANDTDMYPVDSYTPPVTDDEGIPNCPEGYIYDEVLKSCRFVGFSEPAQEQRNREDSEERPYMSIKEMQNASDYDLLKYLTGGSLANSKIGFLPSKLGEDFFLKKPIPNTLTMGLSFLGLNNQEVRRNAMLSELAKRGYDLNTKEGQLGLTQTMGIINNADSSNLGFTPDEINYQIQAKQDAQNIINQGGNPYANTMTGQEVIDDAINSGGTINPFESQGVNAGTNNSSSSFVSNNTPGFSGNPFIDR